MRRISFFGLMMLLLAFAATRASAANMYAYDLDSLVFRGGDIIEGTRMSFREQDDGLMSWTLTEVKVTAVYKGSLKSGQTVLVKGLQFFGPETGGSFDRQSAPKDVRLVFFLSKQQAQTGPPLYHIAGSGMKIIKDGKVGSFEQHSNPGNYVPQYGFPFNDSLPTEQQFRAELAESMKKVAVLEKLFSAEPSPADASWLVAVLRERAKLREKGHRMRDYIAEAASTRLADLRIPIALEEALKTGPSWETGSELGRGYGTQAGREFLLKEIANKNKPVDQRILLAQVLGKAGGIYHATVTQAGSRNVSLEVKPGAGNAAYLTRLARLALDNIAQEDLCVALVESLGEAGSGFGREDSTDLRQDAKTCAAALKKLYDSTSSGKVKFQIELATNDLGGGTYEALGSASGAVASLLLPPKPPHSVKQDQGEIAFEYSLRNMSGEFPKVDSAFVVLESIADGHKHRVPRPEIAGVNAAGTDSIKVPAGLPHGKYRVYLQQEHDGKVISTGHGFEVEW